LICYIYTNDESCIYLDAPRFYTFAPIGVNRVPAITCGAERARLSTAWTSAKNGFKLPIYGIIPRKNPLPLDPTKVIIKYKTGSTFDKEVIKDWIDRVISPYMVSQGYSQILLIIDQATCHKNLAESYDLIAKGIHVLYIPGRMTGLLQPADVGWFATVKKILQTKME